MGQMESEQQGFASDTSQRTLGEWGRALTVLLVGVCIAHLGVTLFLLSEMGTDTFTVFIQGLSRTFHMTVGTMHVIVLALLMVLMLATTKGYVKPGSVVCVLFGGPVIDLYAWMLGGVINGEAPLPVRILSMVAGCIILSLGMSIVINSNAGTGPNDLVAVILTDKIKKVEFRWIRMACDAVFVALGFLLGGTVGIGTIVAICLIGPLVQFWLPRTGKVVRSILKEENRQEGTEYGKQTDKL